MSLSWIKNIKREELHTRRTLGITFGRASFSATLVAQSKKQTRLEWHEDFDLELPFFQGKPTLAHRAALDSLLQTINLTLEDRYVLTQVFLPDPVAWYGFYTLNNIPVKAEQARQLACWRIAKQYHVKDQPLVCDYQVLGDLQDKKLMLAVAMDSEWLTFLQAALHENHILPGIMDTCVSQHFNLLEMTAGHEAGAMIDVNQDYWTILAWDNLGRPRFVRSSWRDHVDTTRYDSCEQIAGEIIETLLVYSNESNDSRISDIYVVGNGQEQQALAAILNNYLSKPVECFAPQQVQKGIVSPATGDFVLRQHISAVKSR